MEEFTDSLVCRKCGAFCGMSRSYCAGCPRQVDEHMHLDCGCGYKRITKTKDAPVGKEQEPS